MDFVDPKDRSQLGPCHSIPLNEAGKTLAELELEGSEWKTVGTVKAWLREKIGRITTERSDKLARAAR
jgi:hypothetical protein